MARSTLFAVLALSQMAIVVAGTNTTSIESIFEPTTKTNLGGSILAVVSILVGGGLLSFGYRFLYEAVFAIGFAIGGVVFAVLAESMFAEKAWLELGSWLAFIFGGILCGGIVMWTSPKSNFVTGMAAAVTLAVIVTNSAAYVILPGHTQELFQVFCVAFGVVFVAFDMKFGKPVQIVATSIFGSGALVWGVGFFAGDFPFPNDLESYATENPDGKLHYSIPATWWGYLSGIVVFAVLGALLQFYKTAGEVFVDDEFKGFGPNGFGYPIDAYPYNETDTSKMARTSVAVDNFATTARESDMPSSYRPQQFCQLYSRNTEAMSFDKARAKFLEARAQSIDMKNPMDTKTQLKPVKNVSSRGKKIDRASRGEEF